MGKIIAIANQKGGVAKTTTCINLGASLAATKRRVLLVDLDPQGNATVGSGIDKNSLELSSYHVLLGKADAKDVIVRAEAAKYDVLPTNGDLTAAEVELMNMMVAREQRLRQALAKVRDDYDFILIDCPPSLNMLTLNAMVAADSVMIPMQCEYYALEGLSALVNTIEEIRGSVNPNLEIEGLLRTMYDPRNNLSTDVSGQLIMHFGDKVYRTVIPRNVRLAEAPSFGLPALAHDRTSRGAVAYLALAGEILRRGEQTAAARH
jgi:chromosome partitioning protein